MLRIKAREAADTIFKLFGLTQLRTKVCSFICQVASARRQRSDQTLLCFGVRVKARVRFEVRVKFRVRVRVNRNMFRNGNAFGQTSIWASVLDLAGVRLINKDSFFGFFININTM